MMFRGLSCGQILSPQRGGGQSVIRNYMNQLNDINQDPHSCGEFDLGFCWHALRKVKVE